MAVTVEQAPLFLLDEDYLIVESRLAEHEGQSSFLGRSLWDCYPGAEPLFRPYCERARRLGRPVEFVQYYDGVVSRVHVAPASAGLAFTWEPLARLDTLTLQGLNESLVELIEMLEAHEDRTIRKRAHGTLRVIAGTG